jgi:nucleotide-binding universal stress UspA family protein
MQPLQIRSILVASDLLGGSDAVVHSAAGLAARLDAQLHLVSAVEFSSVPYSAMGVSGEYQRQMDDARQALHAQADRLIRKGARPASLKVRVGGAPQTILKRAVEFGADLIVMGPARPRAFRGRILGNTADHVIRSSRQPVLVLRHSTPLQLRRVVVPIDIADPARGALDLGLQWADRLGPSASDSVTATTETRVLYVVPRRYEDSGVPFDRVVALPQLQLEIEDAQQRVGARPEVEVTAETAWGDVASDEIVRYVEADPPDLLVLGTHGYGALGRAFIGSVTSRIVRAATCPMLLVPTSMWAVEPAGGS